MTGHGRLFTGQRHVVHVDGARWFLALIGLGKAERFDAAAVGVHIDDALLHVTMADGSKNSVPFEWFPRLRNATAAERGHWRFIGRGQGIHWPDIDEDISVAGLLRLV